jgi:hypothetical protein
MAYANVTIAPSPRSRFVLDERLIQELTDTLYDTVHKALDDYLTPVIETSIIETSIIETSTIEPPVIEPPAIEPPVIEPPAIEPPADKSNSYGIDYSPVDEPPSVQADFTIQPI